MRTPGHRRVRASMASRAPALSDLSIIFFHAIVSFSNIHVHSWCSGRELQTVAGSPACRLRAEPEGSHAVARSIPHHVLHKRVHASGVLQPELPRGDARGTGTSKALRRRC